MRFTLVWPLAAALLSTPILVSAQSCPVSAPANGNLGTCPPSLSSGNSCQFICNAGFTLMGSATYCSYGTLSAQTCAPSSCAVTAPTNGALGTCPSSLSSGSSCQLSCNAGFTLTGSATSCTDGSLTAQTCVQSVLPGYGNSDLWLFISDQTAGTTLALNMGIAINTLLPASSLFSGAYLATVSGSPFIVGGSDATLFNYIQQARLQGDELEWAVEGVNYTSAGTQDAPGTVIGIANFSSFTQQFTTMSFRNLEQWANNGSTGGPAPVGGFNADVYYMTVTNTYTIGGSVYTISQGSQVGNVWGAGIGNVGGSTNLYGVGPDQAGNALGQSTVLLAATGNSNNGQVQSYNLGTIVLTYDGQLIFTPSQVATPAVSDGPLPLWALGVLGAGLIGIASRRLKKAA